MHSEISLHTPLGSEFRQSIFRPWHCPLVGSTIMDLEQRLQIASDAKNKLYCSLCALCFPSDEIAGSISPEMLLASRWFVPCQTVFCYPTEDVFSNIAKLFAHRRFSKSKRLLHAINRKTKRQTDKRDSLI